jgi:hypothetical protein
MITKPFKRTLTTIIIITVILTVSVLASSAQALDFEFNGDNLNYLMVSCNPDIVKPGPGGTVDVSVTAKLAVATNQTEVMHITIYVDTASETRKTITEGDIILPENMDPAKAQYTVIVPSDAINNTYVQIRINYASRIYSGISLALIQNPTYNELTTQIQNLESTNNTISLFAYIATFVAIIFIAATAYIVALTLKASKKPKTFKQTTLSSDEAEHPT